MEKNDRGWSLQGPIHARQGGRGTDPDAGGEAAVAGDDEEGQSKNSSVTPGQKGDREVRERRRKKGGALQFRRGGGLLQQTTARPGGAAARCRGRRGGGGHNVMATEAERLGQGGTMQQERRSTSVRRGRARPTAMQPHRGRAEPAGLPGPARRGAAVARKGVGGHGVGQGRRRPRRPETARGWRGGRGLGWAERHGRGADAAVALGHIGSGGGATRRRAGGASGGESSARLPCLPWRRKVGEGIGREERGSIGLG
nr:translation initiation factor IF-2-like [Aegilops tauschii subsp. strangulata]